MRKLTSIFLLLLTLSACESVNFKKVALYDVYEAPEIAQRSAPIIFEESVGTMWNSLFDCGDFEVTQKVAHTGKTSIKLSWDKGKGCEWIGFGNSFNNWTPTDMSQERFKKALSFYVRTQTKTAGVIPIVANLEDFGGGGSYHFVGSKEYLYGLEIDTNWTQVVVPLWHFPVDDEMVDIYSIKQMQFQLEGAGAFYLDDLKLIDYTEADFQKMKAEVELMKPKGALNQRVYTEGKLTEDAWGHQNNRCQTLEEFKEADANYCIHWKYDSKDCAWAKWGINWNGWYQVNFRGIDEQAKIQFRVKATKGAQFNVMLNDFHGHSAVVYTSSKGANLTDWTIVEVPLKDLKLKEKKFVLDQIRQLSFEGTDAGEVWLDDIRIIGP